MYDHAYLNGSTFLLAIWFVLYVLWPEQRRGMLRVSLLLGLTGPIGEYWALPDYWRPQFVVAFRVGRWQFGPEDYLFMFAVAGICVALFERSARRAGFGELPRVGFATLARIVGWTGLGLALMFAMSAWPRWRAIQVILAATVITAMLMLGRRPRLAMLALLLAAPVGLAYWLCCVLLGRAYPGVFEAVWNLERTCGLLWLGVPVEEFFWATAAMLFIGPLVRACSGRSACEPTRRRVATRRDAPSRNAPRPSAPADPRC